MAVFCFDVLILTFAILDDGAENTSKWKKSLLARTQSKRSASLMQLVYGKPSTEVDNDSNREDSSDEEIFVPKGQKKVTVCCMQDNLY